MKTTTALITAIVLTTQITVYSQEAATNTPATTNSSASLPDAGQKSEKYEKIDAKELSIECMTRLTYVEHGADNNLVNVQGVVTTLTVANKPVELKTNAIVQEGDDAFIVTKNLGKIMIRFNSNSTFSLWLTPTQIQSVKEMAK